MMSNIIISVFETNVKKLRDKTAVIDSKTGVNLTYGELDIWAGRIASKLQHLGIGKGSSVAIVLPQNTDYVASMLAVMKLGAAFAPLIYYYPQERINYILNDCQARVVINGEFMDDVADYPPFTEKDCLKDMHCRGTEQAPKNASFVYLNLCIFTHCLFRCFINNHLLS